MLTFDEFGDGLLLEVLGWERVCKDAMLIVVVNIFKQRQRQSCNADLNKTSKVSNYTTQRLRSA